MKHSLTCKMAFGRKDKTCPRCIELLNGASPIVWKNNRREDAKMTYSVKDEEGKGPETEFSTYKDAKSYAKTASLMYTMIMSVFENGVPVAHLKAGRLIYSK